jgi:hypothetical protein
MQQGESSSKVEKRLGTPSRFHGGGSRKAFTTCVAAARKELAGLDYTHLCALCGPPSSSCLSCREALAARGKLAGANYINCTLWAVVRRLADQLSQQVVRCHISHSLHTCMRRSASLAASDSDKQQSSRHGHSRIAMALTLRSSSPPAHRLWSPQAPSLSSSPPHEPRFPSASRLWQAVDAIT